MSDLEDDYNPRAHTSLLEAVSGLKKTQHIRRSTRDEPKIKQDEFELVKGSHVVPSDYDDDTKTSTAIGVHDLVQVLHKKKKHLDAGKQLRNVHRTKKVFNKPLEKPTADRIKRQVGYEKVKGKLERWDAVVSKNRAAETQVFPLPTETVYIDTSLHAKPLANTIKSDLRREMEAAEEKLRQLKRKRECDFDDETALEKRQNELQRIQLTREELVARRKELAYLKMRESQQSAKARMRNKIKSKKYHKLLRRQKLQEQLKEFEQLQKTDPEAALEKLNELEKSRVRERATLRHKNTGSWAKNLQVRAKYDKDVRKDLAEQLQMSRELTQKSKLSDDDEQSDEEIKRNIKEEPQEGENEVCNDPLNPWLTASKKSAVISKASETEQGENWRKYWMDRNRNEKLLNAYKNELIEAQKQQDSDFEQVEDEEANEESDKVDVPKKLVKRDKSKSKKSKLSTHKKGAEYINGWLVESIESEPNQKNKLEPLPDIDDIFDEVEERIETRLQEKLNKLAKATKNTSKSQKQRNTKKDPKGKADELRHLNDLSFKNQAKFAKLDEQLGEENQVDKAVALTLNPIIKAIEPKDIISAVPDSTTQANVDPTNFPTVTLKQPHLNDMNNAFENDENDNDDDELDDIDRAFRAHQKQRMSITEAFEDDDIVADFGQEKRKDTEIKNTEIEITMPGWGSWAGAGLDEAAAATARNSKKRLVLKLAESEKRRDENKDAIFINEESNKHLRQHLVSDLPFPFTSLNDYEASIRAPIGRNFVPETAFRMLTRPAVITRKGAIIEPMDETELSKRPKRAGTVIDARIQRATSTVVNNK